MKAVILTGGLGTRISEESHLRPKPMIEIGGRPILWHIMKTAIQPPGRYGAVGIEDCRVTSFAEKPAGDRAWVNGGFLVLDPRVIDYIDGDQTPWESEPLMRLSRDDQLRGYQHSRFW